MQHEQEVLHGGNVNTVMRIGNTVRRAPCANPLVHVLLNHLAAQGFTGAPAFLGMDDNGLDIFSYIPGDTAGNDYPDMPGYMWSDESLTGIARLLRGYHDATQGLAATLPVTSGFLEAWDNEVVCHNDAAPYNIVFCDKKPATFIDFDMAAPGPRIWDIAYTLYTAVPLAGFSPAAASIKTVPYSTDLHASDRRRRVRLFMDVYGIELPVDLKHIVIERIRVLCDTLTNEAARGNMAFQKMIEEGHLAHYEQELLFLNNRFNDWV